MTDHIQWKRTHCARMDHGGCALLVGVKDNRIDKVKVAETEGKTLIKITYEDREGGEFTLSIYHYPGPGGRIHPVHESDADGLEKGGGNRVARVFPGMSFAECRCNRHHDVESTRR